MENYSIYMHTNLTNGKRYIGLTGRKPSERWGANGENYTSTPHFWNAICKYGWGGFSHEILLTGLTKDEACEAEKRLIAEYNTQSREFGYNVMEGGIAPTIPDEVRKKMSASMIGNTNGLGKVCSEEKKKKISDAQKGRKLTQKHKQKLSLAKKGKKHAPPSEETRKKISDSHKKKPVICTDTGAVYPSIQECSRQLDIPATNICGCCKHKFKQVGGLHFEYADVKMPNDYPEREYTQAGGNGSPLTHEGEGEDIV